MAILRGYLCNCGENFEHTNYPDDPVPVCPACQRVATEKDQVMGGNLFSTIVPMSRSSLKHKAGFVHSHADRPAEKKSVAVPSKVSF